MINYYSRCAILASREIPAVVNVINYYSRCAILASDKINKSVQALREIKILTAVPILAPDLVGHPLQLTLAGTACQSQNMGRGTGVTQWRIFLNARWANSTLINLTRWP